MAETWSCPADGAGDAARMMRCLVDARYGAWKMQKMRRMHCCFGFPLTWTFPSVHQLEQHQQQQL